MRKTGLAVRRLRFIVAALAALALTAALAFWYAAPLRPARPAEDGAAGSLLDAARVDLNHAGLEALCTLPGIGEKKAQAIMDDRAANGPYVRVEDVTRVSGITQNTIADWSGLAYAGGKAE